MLLRAPVTIRILPLRALLLLAIVLAPFEVQAERATHAELAEYNQALSSLIQTLETHLADLQTRTRRTRCIDSHLRARADEILRDIEAELEPASSTDFVFDLAARRDRLNETHRRLLLPQNADAGATLAIVLSLLIGETTYGESADLERSREVVWQDQAYGADILRIGSLGVFAELPDGVRLVQYAGDHDWRRVSTEQYTALADAFRIARQDRSPVPLPLPLVTTKITEAGSGSRHSLSSRPKCEPIGADAPLPANAPDSSLEIPQERSALLRQITMLERRDKDLTAQVAMWTREFEENLRSIGTAYGAIEANRPKAPHSQDACPAQALFNWPAIEGDPSFELIDDEFFDTPLEAILARRAANRHPTWLLAKVGGIDEPVLRLGGFGVVDQTGRYLAEQGDGSYQRYDDRMRPGLEAQARAFIEAEDPVAPIVIDLTRCRLLARPTSLAAIPVFESESKYQSLGGEPLSDRANDSAVAERRGTPTRCGPGATQAIAWVAPIWLIGRTHRRRELQ